ncbi:MAG: sigma-70 family RNA polymerase sigma factor [Bacteroidales bacterium]|nr:sigma-70 family RNA polymerase sigma factor [Bacteroidales bacterium]
MIFKFTRKPSSKKSDEELIAEFSSGGDLDVLGELYSGYMHLVYGVCMKYLKDREDATDAVMQIFEKLIAEVPRQRIENFRNWLHVVTKNYCLMQLRTKKTHEEKLKELTADSVIFMENPYDLHPMDKEDLDIEEALAECIERLKNDQRECIKKFYFENRCYNEIAALLDLDVNKVKSHLQNGKRNLKICLEEKNERKRQAY